MLYVRGICSGTAASITQRSLNRLINEICTGLQLWVDVHLSLLLVQLAGALPRQQVVIILVVKVHERILDDLEVG